MKEKHLGIPHDLLNGKEGSKQIKIDSGWYGRDSTKEQYQGAILFNGEIAIVSKATADSAGIFGRIIMVKHPPFPASYSETDVEDLKQRAYDNGGFFAEPWLTHVASLNKQDIVARLQQIRGSFQIEGADKLYGRLTTKATLPIFCLEEFNHLFQTAINIQDVLDVLKASMQSGTSNVNVADRIMSWIVW